jgi:hypothetical protein
MTPQRRPGVRAGNAQDTLAALDRVQTGLGAAVLARMPPDAAAELRAASRTAFLPLAIDRWFVGSIVEELGYPGAVAAIRATVGVHFESPLLRALVTGAGRLFGAGPRGLFKLLPRGWGLVYRDVGDVAVLDLAPEGMDMDTRGGWEGVIVRVDGVDPAFAAELGYRASFEAMLGGILDIRRVPGQVLLDPPGEPPGLQATVHWQR